MINHELYPRDSSGEFFNASGKEVLPTKQNLSKKELSEVNLRGYAAFVQELYGINDPSLGEKGLLRKNNTLDPFKTGIDPSKIRALVEGVEAALETKGISPRGKRAIRLYFGLDQPNGSKFMSIKDVGKELKDFEEKRAISGNRARQIIARQMRHIAYTRPKEILDRLWRDGDIS